MELEESAREFQPVADRRPRLPEPLPVRLVAVEDVRLPAVAGLETELDSLYVGLLGMERVKDANELIYRTDNVLLRFEVGDKPVVHESMRPLGVEVPSLREMEKKLVDAEVAYLRQKRLTPGSVSLVLLDPAGNWVQLLEMRPVR